MMERFSDRARHAMALANLEASRLNHDSLTPEHIMLGLIAEGQCVATEALRLLEVDLTRVREQVGARIASKRESSSTVGRRAHSPETKEVIGLAIEEARRFGHRYIGTEHLVLALLGQTEGVPSKVLREQGVELEQLREKTLAMLQSGVDATHDLSHSRHGDFEWVHQQELSKAFRSTKFWHTMILAVDSANRAGAGEVEPEHLLMALCRDENTRVAKLLQGKGITADGLRDILSTGA